MRIDAIFLHEVHIPLDHPFETSFGTITNRHALLIELKAEGLTGWGECVAGEHPYLSEESIDTAWQVLSQELAPALVAAEPAHGGKCPGIFKKVRGNFMAKAALENAVWDLEAQMRGISLAALLGGTREKIDCEAFVGIRSTIDEQLAEVEREVSAGYRHVKLNCRPGWDTKVFEAVRTRWPEISLSCDANSSYRLHDAAHIASWDSFDLQMIEQPLWADDFYFHSMLQKQLKTPICLDDSIRNRRDALAAIDMESCTMINIKVGRVGGFSEAIAIHNAAQERGIPVLCGGLLETGIGRAHNIALASLENFRLAADISAATRYWKEDIVEPDTKISSVGEVDVPETPGRGFEVRDDLIDRLAVRSEEIRDRDLAVA
jgi:O-succinylbenzoate synthase